MFRNLLFGALLLVSVVALGDDQKNSKAGDRSPVAKKSGEKPNAKKPAPAARTKRAVAIGKTGEAKKRVAASDPRQKDREAILDAVRSYVDAYNAGNAKAVAAHWSSKGVWVDQESGERVSGSEALRKHFTAALATEGRPLLNVRVKSLRFIADTVAVEDGVAQLVDAEGVSENTYTAIHVKEGNHWKVDSVRENAASAVENSAAPSKYEHLRELEWMIGEWSDSSENSSVETSCRWTKNRNFITQTFQVVVDGQVDLEGTQVIGWDPVNATIRSWVFDSDGGFGQGVWTRKGDRWVVRNAQTLADGSTASSVNVFRYIDENSYGWQSIGREVNGEFAPNIDEVIVSRASSE